LYLFLILPAASPLLAPRSATLPNPALAAIPVGNQLMFRFFETRIDPFRDHDESTPPCRVG
jgi:hypothetical protein